MSSPDTFRYKTRKRPIVASATTGADAAKSPPALDACRVGVVVRALLLVHANLLVLGLLWWRGNGAENWLLQAGLVIGCSLPATLLWLIVTGMCKTWLARCSERIQWLACTINGAACGFFAGLLFASVMGAEAVSWWGCMALGMLLAGQLTAMLLLRTRLQAPGDVAAQLTELQARIRPHFLFNALNSAIALVRVNPERAESLLEDLSDLFRHMLRDVRHNSTLGQELELAQRYLQIEEVRFGQRLRIAWQTDPAANLAAVPALILQPLLENAIRHGVEPSPSGASIWLSTALKGNMVCITVANTFPAGAGKPGNGIALNNVHRRLRLLHDVELQFSARKVDDRFVVRIQFPMQIPTLLPQQESP